jgi:hypothetical protein
MKRIPGSIGIALLMTAVIAAGCGENRASENSASGNNQSVSTAQARQSSKPRTQTMVIPAGTIVLASLDAPLTTATNHSGDSFGATTIEPVIVDGRTVVQSGARIRGVLQDVQASGRISGRARMTLAYQDIVDSAGKTHSISALPLTIEAGSGTVADVEKIAGGGVLGAIIGGIAGGKKGALIGAGAGAGAGTVLVLATKGHDVDLPAGQRLNVQMTSSTSIVLVAQK